MRAVRYDSGMCNPDSHMTLGSSISIQSLYYLNLLSKWEIQLTKFFWVYGASFAHIGGKNPLKNEFPSVSKSALIPISPFNALFRSLIDDPITTISMLNRSNSCKSTIYVGEGILKLFLILYSSKTSGNVFVKISSAI